ncbi:MAG: EAL domain-containing protein [Treponemataceae bacterium]|nr:EAL domain-containing protein [Treponemataceae bacterium]
MQERIIYFTVCAIINTIALLFTIYLRKFTKGAQNVIFLWTTWIILGSGISDFFCTFYQLYFPQLTVQRFISTTVYFILRNYSPIAFFAYILVITNATHRFKKHKIFNLIFMIPYAIDVIAIIANIFTHHMFHFDENGLYQRGPMIYMNYASSAFYMILGVINLFAFRKVFSKSKILALFAMYILLLLSVIIQFIWPYVLIEIFFTSVALIIVMVLVQRPEEYTDANLGIYNYFGFSNYCKNLFINKAPVNIIIIKAVNYESYEKILNYNQFIQLLSDSLNEIQSFFKANKIHGDIYYINKGRFAITLIGKYRQVSRNIAERIKARGAQLFDYDSFKAEIKMSVAHIQMTGKTKTSDIADFNTLRNFIEQFHEIPHESGKVISLEDKAIKKYFDQYVAIDGIIKDALENNRFEMYYQPIYSISEKRIISAEALIRLIDDRHEYISPEVFIPASERSGAIIQIGEFVLDSVCKFIASEEFKKTGIDYIELNLSVSQCMQPDIADKVEYYVNKWGIRADQINLEITESAVDKTANTMLKNISKLAAKGYKFSLDDYGTGYSNIKRVVTLPLQIIKFDKTFVNEVKNPQMQIVLKNNIEMIKEMNMEIVVEGIETKEMLDIFSDYRCDFIQGYYFSKPLPKDTFVEWTQNWKEKVTL